MSDQPRTCTETSQSTSSWGWLHSSFSSGADATCVDVAIGSNVVAVRDSKNPDGPILTFNSREWEVFLLGVRNGEFELPPC